MAENEYFENDNQYKAWVMSPHAQQDQGFDEQNKDLSTSNLSPEEIELLYVADSIINYSDDIDSLKDFKRLMFRDMALIINTAKARKGWFLQTVNSQTVKKFESVEHNKLAQKNLKEARQF